MKDAHNGAANGEWLSYDFVEIGTSDFRTLSQFVQGSDRTCGMGYALRNWNPRHVRGLAVEPVKHLLAHLPTLPLVEKVNVAMGLRDGETILYSVRENACDLLPKSYAVHLARGTGTIRRKHPQLLQAMLSESIKFDDVMEKLIVPIWSFEKLARYYRIRSIDVLKIDCEGSDNDILDSLIDYCDQWQEAFPRVICFETNALSSVRDIRRVRSKLKARRYTEVYSGHDTVLKRRQAERVICCDFLRGVCRKGSKCYFDHMYDPKSFPCCYGDQCCHGHGGASPLCIACERYAWSNCCFCSACYWERWSWEHPWFFCRTQDEAVIESRRLERVE